MVLRISSSKQVWYSNFSSIPKSIQFIGVVFDDGIVVKAKFQYLGSYVMSSQIKENEKEGKDLLFECV